MAPDIEDQSQPAQLYDSDWFQKWIKHQTSQKELLKLEDNGEMPSNYSEKVIAIRDG